MSSAQQPLGNELFAFLFGAKQAALTLKNQGLLLSGIATFQAVILLQLDLFVSINRLLEALLFAASTFRSGRQSA